MSFVSTYLDAGTDDHVPVDPDLTQPCAAPASSATADLTLRSVPADSPTRRPAPSARQIGPGTILRGRYVLEQVIGRGGDSVVFRARDLHRTSHEDSTDGSIALKVLLPQQRVNLHALTRFRRQFRQMQTFSHPGIVRVFDLDCDGDVWFMTMELIVGESLQARLSRSTPLAERLKLIFACCEALEHAHALGILHGDLKPSNVLVSDDGRAKLIDFGCAVSAGVRLEGGSDPSLASTPCYASPQVLAGITAEARDDIFSLACLAYWVLSHGGFPFGRKVSLEAFKDNSRPAYDPNIPARLFEVIARGLAPERELRPDRARDFLHALMSSAFHPAAPPTGESASQRKAVTHVGSSLLLSSPVEFPPLRGTIEIVPHRPDPQRARWDARWSRFKVASRGHIGSFIGAARRFRLTPLPRLKYFSMPRNRRAAAGVSLVLAAGLFLLSRASQQQFGATAVPAPATAHAVTHLPPVAPLAAVAPVPIQPAEELEASTGVTREPPSSGVITFESPVIHAVAAQSLVAIPLKRLRPTREAGSVAWTIESGSAQPGVDYEPMGRQVVKFNEGQAIRALFIPLKTMAGPNFERDGRTFTVALHRVAGGPALGPVAKIRVTILPAQAAAASLADSHAGTMTGY